MSTLLSVSSLGVLAQVVREGCCSTSAPSSGRKISAGCPKAGEPENRQLKPEYTVERKNEKAKEKNYGLKDEMAG